MARLRRDIRFTFTGGEVSPLLLGRSDFEKYYTMLEKEENFTGTPLGPAERRYGTRFVAEVKDSSKQVRLIPFHNSATQTYVLEFGNLYMRVYRDGGQVQSGGSPYELVTPYTEADLVDIDFTQSPDILTITHPNFAPRKVTRVADDNWSISAISYSPPPTVESTIDTSGGQFLLGIAGNTGNGIEVRSKSDIFQKSDVGRTVVAGLAIGVLTTFVDAKNCKIDIIVAFNQTITTQTPTLSSVSTTVDFSAAHGLAVDDFIVLNSGAQSGQIRRVTSITDVDTVVIDVAFTANQGAGTAWKKSTGIAAGSWKIAGSPNVSIRTTKKGPELAITTLSEDVASDAPWRSSDVGKFVRMNNGIIKVTKFTNSASIDGQILKVLSSTTTAQGGEWLLEEEAWTAANGFPRSITRYEGRILYGGTAKFPDTLWGTATEEPENLGSGTSDDDAFSFTLSSSFLDTIQWLAALKRLFVGTLGAEHVVNDGQTDPITPSNIAVRGESTVGSPHIRPIRVNDTLVFINRHKNKVFALGFSFQEDSFIASNLLLFAEHMAGVSSGSLTRLAFQQETRPIIWVVRSDGMLIGITFERRQNVVAAHRHIIGGVFGSGQAVAEDVVVIPHWTDPYDTVWVVVKRTINGVTKRYIEYFDRSLNTDSALTRTPNGTPVTSVSGLGHLEGQTVWVVGDSVPQAKRTVSAGVVSVTPAADKVEVGLEYISKLTTPPLQNPGLQLLGLTKRVIKAIVDFSSTVDAVINGKVLTLGTPTSPLTDEVIVENLGYDTKGRVTVEQQRPLPMTVVAIAGEVAIDEDRR